MTSTKRLFSLRIAALLVACTTARAVSQENKAPGANSAAGINASVELPSHWAWAATGPIIAPHDNSNEQDNQVVAIKDPSVIQQDGTTHLFVTVRGTKRSHAIGHIQFKDWADAGKAPLDIVNIDGFAAAPQIFYFTPHRKWYLICQASRDDWTPAYQPAFSTSDDIVDSNSWAPLQPLYGRKPSGVGNWLDFWVICDERKAHLFFTSLDGRLWQASTTISEFPKGWTDPKVTLQDAIFEASHTYKVRGSDRFLTIIEQDNGGDGWRFFKAYESKMLEGPWKPLAATREAPFASIANVSQPEERWTDSISHGEIIRTGVSERLEIDLAELQFIIQGVLDKDRMDREYGKIPWKLGLLRRVTPGR